VARKPLIVGLLLGNLGGGELPTVLHHGLEEWAVGLGTNGYHVHREQMAIHATTGSSQGAGVDMLLASNTEQLLEVRFSIGSVGLVVVQEGADEVAALLAAGADGLGTTIAVETGGGRLVGLHEEATLLVEGDLEGHLDEGVGGAFCLLDVALSKVTEASGKEVKIGNLVG